jgi:hypothetical protein
MGLLLTSVISFVVEVISNLLLLVVVPAYAATYYATKAVLWLRSQAVLRGLSCLRIVVAADYPHLLNKADELIEMCRTVAFNGDRKAYSKQHKALFEATKELAREMA